MTIDAPETPGSRRADADSGGSTHTAEDRLWEFRWREEDLFSNRQSIYLLAQSFLVIAAVTATVAPVPVHRWLLVALVIDVVGLGFTVLFWYVLTENVRMLHLLKEKVEEGDPSINALRAAQEKKRQERRPRVIITAFSRLLSPSEWLSTGVSVVLGCMWGTLIVVAVIGAH